MTAGTDKAGAGIAATIALDRRPASRIGTELDYVHVTRSVRNLLIGVVLLVAVLVALSLFIKVEEVARARGDFTPVERIQAIQTAEGGALEALLVRNDERVEPGQVIARFRATDLVRDLAVSDVRAARLQIEIERLDAFADQREPDLVKFAEKYPRMVEEALQLHRQQVRGMTQSLAQKDQQIAEVKSGLDASQRLVPSMKVKLDAASDLEARVKDGVRTGVIARNRLAEVEAQLAAAQRDYTQEVALVEQQKARIQSLEAERDGVIAKLMTEVRDERSERIEQMNELVATMSAFRSRSTDIEVKAPIRGIIQNISVTRLSSVVPPGGTICEIVPTDGGVLMQARVSPRDIGFVQVGQRVLVKVDAYDYGRFGAVKGKVVRIAPSSTTPPPGQPGGPFFMTEVELDQPYVGTDKSHLITPGMTAEANILTGEKTIFQYLLKPIYLTADTAFHER